MSKMNCAIVFPGQGSQSVGMLQDLAIAYPSVLSVFTRVSDRLGYDVWQMVQDGPETVLNQTMYTQVAMLTADVALFTLLQEQRSYAPTIMAGHSLGEYAALVCAQSLSLEDAAELVQTRGRLMQETIPAGLGGMAAIVGFTDEQVLEICLQCSNTSEQVTPANYNALGQVVIAGHINAVQKAITLAETSGAKLARLIPVSVPCHCSLLKPAAVHFAKALQDVSFQVPTIPVISNVDLSVYQSADHIRTLLTQQLYSPVRWVETIQRMKAQDVELLIECGPGKVLSGLIKRIDKTLQVMSASDELLHENRARVV